MSSPADTSANESVASPARAEHRVRIVVGLTAAMMVAELTFGYLSNSMALMADGFHMATHVGVLGLSAIAYWFARTRAAASGGTLQVDKIHALAGYTNGAILTVVAIAMGVESIERLLEPEAVDFWGSLPISVLGLVVNLASAFLLHPGGAPGHDHHHHGHDHDHGHDHHHDHAHDHGPAADASGHRDHNLRAAYLHIVADALTSVLAILALCGMRFFGVVWLDPMAGVIGGAVILRWGLVLCRDSARMLVSRAPV